MTVSPPVVSAAGLARTFSGRAAVDDVSLSLGRSECLALFGPNGAGKSTLLRLVAGLLKPTRGSVQVGGVDIRGDSRVRGAVGLISHQTMLYPVLTALENVTFAARLHGVPRPEEAARAALDAMRIGDRARWPVRTLSRGMQQRVSIARAIVHAPQVVLLDEPYTGLDEVGAEALSGLLRDLLARGAALLLVTHNVAEGLTVATQAAIMTAGRLARHEARPAPGFDAAQYSSDYRRLVLHG